jgi:DUF1680 family protein
MLKPIPRKHVRLTAGLAKECQDRNTQYLLSLDVDRLLHNFRVQAGIESHATPLGGWESPGCGLRGHFVGHYLSACAFAYSATGDHALIHRSDELLNGLRQCQQKLSGGYLSAFGIEQFDTLETQFGGVWAPYYTLHKILAGLIDAHVEADGALALTMARELGEWVVRRITSVPPQRLEPMLRTDQLNPSNEYGGIGVSLYDLYELTGDARYLETAKVFDRDWFIEPLINHDDRLAGLHANTHIPQAIAAGRRYQLTGDERYRRAVEFLWQETALLRSYVNAGSSGPRPDRKERSEGGEHWPQANCMAHTLTPKINESCVAHNMARLTDLISSWQMDPRLSEFRQRLFFNSILPVQKPNAVGGYLYSHPLAGGSRKVYGDADQTFWCCYGTSVEAFARLADGTYWHDDDTLYVRQFIASKAIWHDRGVEIIQETTFPYEQQTQMTIRVARPTTFTLNIHAPLWANGAECSLNGQRIVIGESTAFILRRKWSDGDVVDLTLPMSMRVEQLPGDPTHWTFVYGPIVLAGQTSHAVELGVPGACAVETVRTIDRSRLRFEIALVSGHKITLVPLHEIVDEAYGVYFKTPD